MAKVFAFKKEDVGEGDEFVNLGTCPKCKSVVARAMKNTAPLVVDGYEVECDHVDPAAPHVRNDDGSHTNPREGKEAEPIKPVWSVE